MKSFILMLTFLTRIPIPVSFEIKNDDFAKGLLFMPLIGLIIGLPMYLYARFVALSNPYLMSFLLMLIYLGMTGGLHLDGLGDYFDGMFSGRKRERILEIMKDTSMGTFGMVGLCLYFIGLFVGLMEVTPLVVLLMPIVGKSIGLMMCSFGKYPREAGMGQALVDYGQWYHGVVTLIIGLVLLYFAGVSFFIAGSVTVMFMAVFFLRTTQVIGGITGDVIGASVEISQVLWLLVFAVMGGL